MFAEEKQHFLLRIFLLSKRFFTEKIEIITIFITVYIGTNLLYLTCYESS